MPEETPINLQLQAIIDTALAETKAFGWDEDDRKWSACGAAQKYIEANSDLDGTEVQAVVIALVTQAMKGTN